MSNKIDCRIIQDLLPSYVEGLTSEYTNQVVEEHVKECESCSQMLQRMQEPEKRINSTEKEVDYMKKVRNKISGLIAISLISIGIFLLGVIASVMIYNRVVPKTYEQVFSTAEPEWFIAHHSFSDCEIDIFDFEAEEFKEMLKTCKYYYEGSQGNVIYGDMFVVSVGNDAGRIGEFIITDEYKLYYDGKVYDIRDSKPLWDYLDRRITEEPEWTVYEKATYKYLDGKYVMETKSPDEEAISIEFDLDTKSFVLSTGKFSSDLEIGSFSIDGLVVTLNGNNEYVFYIVGDEKTLNFAAEKSDPLYVFAQDTPIPSETYFIKQ